MKAVPGSAKIRPSLRAVALGFMLLLCPYTLSAQRVAHKNKGMETGFYQLTFKAEGSENETTIIIFLRRNGHSLELYDLSRKEKFQSPIVKSENPGLNGMATLRAAEFELKHNDKSVPALLILATSNGKEMFGAGYNKKEQFNVTIASLPSVWACGNHQKPTHTAKSEDDMKQLTVQNGCSLWHKLKESDLH